MLTTECEERTTEMYTAIAGPNEWRFANDPSLTPAGARRSEPRSERTEARRHAAKGRRSRRSRRRRRRPGRDDTSEHPRQRHGPRWKVHSRFAQRRFSQIGNVLSIAVHDADG